MKASEIIEKAKELRPNPYSDAMLIDFINELNMQAQEEIHAIKAADMIIITTDNLDTQELVIPMPYGEACYLYYLLAKVAYFEQEFDLYNNDVEQFNENYTKYFKTYRQATLNKFTDYKYRL